MRIFLILIILYSVIANAHELDEASPSGETAAVEIDKRCLRGEGLNLADTAAVRQFNKLCAIEQEVIRRTNEYRKKNGLSELRPNPELSFVVRYQATLPYNGRNAHQHFNNNIPSYYYRKWFSEGRKLFMARENAFWAFNHNHKSAEALGQMLADDPTNGWNHHAGHHENVLSADTTDIGVGVSLRPDGNLVAYTVFGRAEPK